MVCKSVFVFLVSRVSFLVFGLVARCSLVGVCRCVLLVVVCVDVIVVCVVDVVWCLLCGVSCKLSLLCVRCCWCCWFVVVVLRFRWLVGGCYLPLCGVCCVGMCCVLFVVCCWLRDGCLCLFVVWRLLSVMCCALFVVRCFLIDGC